MINKIDLTHVRERLPELEAEFKSGMTHKRFGTVSAATGEGVDLIVKKLHKMVSSAPKDDLAIMVTNEEVVERMRLKVLKENEHKVRRYRRYRRERRAYRAGQWSERKLCKTLRGQNVHVVPLFSLLLVM